ncbi:hypothetical protein F53441_12586 [Fusarium austroafricanum]|uniref:F-box domain-containing protein n=1 Tax=Fusarium austroafricanum TaxID=2364996 RepID=A0A8H4JYV4_9HYPO|nr:hypothetical protein F53441_12586 [Fusarium austroafricanum]
MSSNADSSTTAPSSTSQVMPTVTKLISLTTPFKQPSGCDSNFAKTSVLPTRTTSTVPILLSTAEPSCYPSGWEDVIHESRLDFYPAVCPSGWTYHTMRTTYSGLSVATCCNSGYTPLNGEDFGLVLSQPYSTMNCGRWTKNGDVQITSSNTEERETLMLHEAWTVYWNNSDTSTLSPQLPTLTSDMIVPTWVPGEDIPPGKYDRTPRDDGPFSLSRSSGQFLLIGLPIMVIERIDTDYVASLETLPPEILLPIVTALPGLDTLWDLMRASPHVWHLFNDHATTIVNGILSGPNAILPHTVAEAVRAVILVRLRANPFRDLSDFQMRSIHSIFPSGSKKLYPITSDGEWLSTATTSAEILRSVVVTTYHISSLSQAFLASCLERVRDPSFKPRCLVNPEDRYNAREKYGPGEDGILPWDQVFESRPVKVVDTGQPTWVEEMRAVRALWVIQLVGEVQHQANDLEWSIEDIEKLKSMSPTDFTNEVSPLQVRSFVDYLKTLGEATQDTYYRLPRPPSYSRWTTALPSRSKDYETSIHYDKKGIACRRVSNTDDSKWGRTSRALESMAPGIEVFRSLHKPRPHPRGRVSPIEGVKFNTYRQLGFAFWDRWRMYNLGMYPEVGKGFVCSETPWFYAWESVLPPEEVASIKAELRATGQKMLEDRHVEFERRRRQNESEMYLEWLHSPVMYAPPW